MGKFEDRIVALEEAVQKLTDRLDRMELFRTEASNQGSIREGKVVQIEDKVAGLERDISDLISRIEAFRLKFNDFDATWPKVSSKGIGGEGSADIVARGTECRNSEVTASRTTKGVNLSTSGDRLVIIGDSLARGVGFKLKEQLGDVVEVKAVGGNRLEQVSQRVGELSKDKTRNLVVVAGANNLPQDRTDQILDKFRRIVENGKNNSSKVCVVGLIKRYDLGSSFERKRIVANSKLKGICRELGVGFIEYEPERSRVHSDGLHLNFRGQHELGKAIYRHHEQCFLV